MKYYHSSPFNFKPGDYINPILAVKKANYRASEDNLIYLTNSPYPHFTLHDKIDEDWNVYEVKPLKRGLKVGMWDDFTTPHRVLILKKVGSLKGLAIKSHHSKKSLKRSQEYHDSMKTSLEAYKAKYEETKDSFVLEYIKQLERDLKNLRAYMQFSSVIPKRVWWRR